MTTKELIQAELDNLSEEQLQDLYTLIRQLDDSQKIPKKPSLMTKLKQIKIDAPENFSINLASDLGRDTVEAENFS